ncbi:MAG: O-antigen ligase family protein [Sphingobacteriaceae bacterium]
MINPDNNKTEIISNIFKTSVLVLIGAALGFVIKKWGYVGAFGLIGGIGAIYYIYLSFINPKLPLKTILILGFFVIGITRYIEGPFGTMIDALLVLTWIALFFQKRNTVNWANANTFVVFFSVVWFLYIVLELLNPESIGVEPWFYAMRGMALYPMLLIPLILILFNKPEDMNWLFKTWFIISIIAAIKGFVQKYIDCDPFEKIWLAKGGAITHVLFGQLRAFSFYSDAGQFGGAMAHASISSFVLFTGKFSGKWRAIYFILFIFFFWGYLISGTRGAIAVTAAGMITYLMLSKNFKFLIVGSILAGSFYYFMAFTQIGQGTYEIRRLRTAFTEGSQDASMVVRTENKKKLRAFLENKPFGGGVASAGDWGKRFRPDSILANIATDSFYVRIWSETGIIGLVLFLFFFFYFIIKGGLIIWKMQESITRTKLLALYSGIIGIMAASYGNSVFSQFPTNMICYTSMCIILTSEKRWLNT